MIITKVQKETLDFIKSYFKKKGYSPTQEEIAKRFHRSLSTIHEHLQKLEEKSEIRLNKNQHRGIEILSSSPMVQIVLKGTIAAGQPLTLFDVPSETIAIPKNKIPPSSEVYALRVEGESMIEENIKNGDIILVRHQSTAENGQKVVALIDNSEATLKKFYKERNHIRLQPANKNIEPIIIKKDREFEIQGIVVDVIKTSNPKFEEVTIQTSKTKRKYKKLPLKLNKIICGDALIELQKLPDESCDVIITDPPYNLGKDFGNDSDKMSSEEYLHFTKKWTDIAIQKLKPNGSFYIFLTWQYSPEIFSLLKKRLTMINEIVWDRRVPSMGGGTRRYSSVHDTIGLFVKGREYHFDIDSIRIPYDPETKKARTRSIFVGKPWLERGYNPKDVWVNSRIHKQDPERENHPTQKPLLIIERMVKASCPLNGIVLDPFMGTGTTAAAAMINRRNFIGFEVNPEYHAMSLKRLKKISVSLIKNSSASSKRVSFSPAKLRKEV